ncbi:MAG: hypothetical protein MZV49_06215 [Rhodopseudomonas palustris]|nr:hypothetical protein [Rhodopseudomonas palustris]
MSPQILHPDEEGQLSYTGLAFSPDGRRAFLSDVNGVGGRLRRGRRTAPCASPARSACPTAERPARKEEIPAGLAVSARRREALRLRQPLEPAARAGRRHRPACCARSTSASRPTTSCSPAGKAYVSNWGGRRPRPGDLTGPAGRGTEVRVDPVRHIASEGSVTVDRPRQRARSRPRS